MDNYQIDRKRWSQFSFLEQMGNIGSEVGRTIQAHQAKDIPKFERALGRALDLFEATIDVMSAQKLARLRELLIAREQFLNLFFADDPINDAQKIEKYFMQYAIAARLHR